LQNNLRILWRGDLQIAPRDNSFPIGSEDPPGTGLCEYISGTQHQVLIVDFHQAARGHSGAA
jgi:hypothetical protein